jgi:hypothetical protein
MAFADFRLQLVQCLLDPARWPAGAARGRCAAWPAWPPPRPECRAPRAARPPRPAPAAAVRPDRPDAATACASALWNASQTASSWPRDASSSGGNFMSTLGQLASACSAAACSCQCATSVRRLSQTACAAAQGLVDRTSMRCASSTAASRCTCTRCCRSSITRMRSASWLLSPTSGSRLSGAPALAASRCQAMASAMLSLATASSACALAPTRRHGLLPSWRGAVVETLAHRTGGALVTAASSRNTSCSCSWCRIPGQPGADARGALARCWRSEGASGQGVELADIGGLGGAVIVTGARGLAGWFQPKPAYFRRYCRRRGPGATNCGRMREQPSQLARFSSARGDHLGSFATGFTAPRNSRSTGSF